MQPGSTDSFALIRIKWIHTVVWAFFVACIVAIPIFSLLGKHEIAAWMIAIVLIEVTVLAINGWQCTVTHIAARYTEDRQANFDIYLPLWLARNNKQLFGPLFLAGCAFAFVSWFWS